MQITSRYLNYQVSSSFDHLTANSNANHRITSNVLFFSLGGHDEPRLLYSREQLGLFIRVILSFFVFFFFSNLHANPLIKSSKSIPRTAGRAPAAVSLSCSSLTHLILRRERSLLSLVAASDLCFCVVCWTRCVKGANGAPPAAASASLLFILPAIIPLKIKLS